jgi:hypothetical protein
MQTELKRKFGEPALLERAVVVVCESELSHAHAVRLCKDLGGRYWNSLQFEFAWWLFRNLEFPGHAAEAAEQAAAADLVVLAVEPTGKLPDTFLSWLETWVPRRGEREGALACVYDSGSESTRDGAAKQLLLRQVARRAGMDFLLDLCRLPPRRLPDSPDWFAERAGQTGSVMEGILQVPIPPPTQAAGATVRC